jgi:hypothetical protein
VAERQLASLTRDDRLLIRVKYSTAGAVAVGNGFLPLIIGEEERTGTRLLAFCDKHENIIRVPPSWACEVPEVLSACEAAAFLKAVVDILLASLLLDLGSPNSTLFVHDASPILYKAIWSQALVKNITPFFTTSNSTLKTQNTLFLHPGTPNRVLNQLIRRNVSAAASFEAHPSPGGIFTRLVRQLPKTAIIKSPDSLYQSSPQLPTNFTGHLGDLLRKFCTTATRLSDSNQSLEVVTLNSIAGRRIYPGQVISWTQQTPILAHIAPVTSLITLSNDKTYLLGGMTGDLGRSLCGWMVSKGARHVVFASRNPNFDLKWIESMANQGAKVVPMSM